MSDALQVSAALLAAQERLYQLRQAAQVRRPVAAGQRAICQPETPAAGNERLISAQNFLADLPAHLGWGNTAMTSHLRTAARRRSCELGEARSPQIASHSDYPTPKKPKQTTKGESLPFVKLYPDIALGMLRQEQAAAGRIWLLLQHVDTPGRGWVSVEQARARLCGKRDSLHVCGWRQLRNLLTQGEGIFWQRDKERIWLRSAAKSAHALDVVRLTGRPVGLPLPALLAGIGKFRAHLYAAFHSGRAKVTSLGPHTMPVSRDTLAGLSGVGASSQRVYEEQANVVVQANFAVGEPMTKENHEKRAWRQGRALFELKDYRGQQGKKGKTYLAWQIPNSYIGQHPQRPKGRQRRINRKLKDLVMKGMPGNAEQLSDARKPKKVYYPNGKLAAKAYGRESDQELYWHRQKTRNGRFDLWHLLGNGQC